MYVNIHIHIYIYIYGVPWSPKFQLKLDATDPSICTLRLRTVAGAATLRCVSSISGWGSVMQLGCISSARRNSLSNWNLIRLGKHKKLYNGFDLLSRGLFAVVPRCCCIFLHQGRRQIWRQLMSMSMNYIGSRCTPCFFLKRKHEIPASLAKPPVHGRIQASAFLEIENSMFRCCVLTLDGSGGTRKKSTSLLNIQLARCCKT